MSKQASVCGILLEPWLWINREGIGDSVQPRVRPGQPRVHSQVRVGSGEEVPAVFDPTDRRTHAHSHNCRVPNLLDAVHVPPLAFLTPSHRSNLCRSGQPPTCPGLWPLLHVLLAPRAVETSSSRRLSSGGLSVHSVPSFPLPSSTPSLGNPPFLCVSQMSTPRADAV